MRVRRGDVVSVDLGGPNDDDTRGGEIYKTRPAVVIQNDVGNEHSVTTIVAPISGGRTNYPFHVNLPGSMDELDKDSHVQLDQIRTVDNPLTQTQPWKREKHSRLTTGTQSRTSTREMLVEPSM